jgi:hypothetical protein
MVNISNPNVLASSNLAFLVTYTTQWVEEVENTWHTCLTWKTQIGKKPRWHRGQIHYNNTCLHEMLQRAYIHRQKLSDAIRGAWLAFSMITIWWYHVSLDEILRQLQSKCSASSIQNSVCLLACLVDHGKEQAKLRLNIRSLVDVDRVSINCWDRPCFFQCRWPCFYLIYRILIPSMETLETIQFMYMWDRWVDNDKLLESATSRKVSWNVVSQTYCIANASAVMSIT